MGKNDFNDTGNREKILVDITPAKEGTGQNGQKSCCFFSLHDRSRVFLVLYGYEKKRLFYPFCCGKRQQSRCLR